MSCAVIYNIIIYNNNNHIYTHIIKPKPTPTPSAGIVVVVVVVQGVWKGVLLLILVACFSVGGLGLG